VIRLNFVTAIFVNQKAVLSQRNCAMLRFVYPTSVQPEIFEADRRGMTLKEFLPFDKN